ncbi:MAG TPA: MotA/TolQ/ExbB proton channel family protein [Bacteroidia bacterium]|nr:MotA/TolQ/ExbB proton channel family protein [Bacteroidia bacterium]
MTLTSILLQITQPVDSAAIIGAAAVPPPQETMTLWQLTLKGGPVMIPIAILSLIAVYIIIERYLVIRKSSRDETNFMNNIRDFIKSGNIDAARSLSKNTSSPIARMIEKGVSRIGKPLGDIEKAIENTGNIEIFKLERGLSLLATCAGAAPMLGFLGTVTGMVQAFYNMSKAGDQIKLDLLSGGMYQAMITTVAGLIVGICALIGYNLLASMVQKIIFKLETSTIEFMDLLQEPGK